MKALSAEREGFEPSIPFWSIHTFQACSFDHSDTSPLDEHLLEGTMYRSGDKSRFFYAVLKIWFEINQSP